MFDEIHVGGLKQLFFKSGPAFLGLTVFEAPSHLAIGAYIVSHSQACIHL